MVKLHTDYEIILDHYENEHLLGYLNYYTEEEEEEEEIRNRKKSGISS